MNVYDFEESLNKVEKDARQYFKEIATDNRKAENQLQSCFKIINSLKIHFLNSHLDFFRGNLGALNDERGDRFHQNNLTMKKRYHGKWNSNIFPGYYWTLNSKK